MLLTFVHYLILTIKLVNIKLHYQVLCKIMFFLLCTLVTKDNVYNKSYKITTYMQVNVIK
jgi:hypothetical protein